MRLKGRRTRRALAHDGSDRHGRDAGCFRSSIDRRARGLLPVMGQCGQPVSGRRTMSPVMFKGTHPGQKGKTFRTGKKLSTVHAPETEIARFTTASPQDDATCELTAS